jgi:hypothetical protein
MCILEPIGESPFCFVEGSEAICGVLGSKPPEAYSLEYVEDGFEPAAWHLAASPSPRYEGIHRQAPGFMGSFPA